MPWLILFILVGLPLIELYLLIEIGSVIGAAQTILLSLATAALGITLVRRQGLGILARLQREARTADRLGVSLVHGFFLAFAGLLLLVPGFMTDTLGALLLIPPVRLWMGRGLVTGLARSGGRSHTVIIIDGEVYESSTGPKSEPAEGETEILPPRRRP